MQAGMKIHSNTWPDIYQSVILYVDIERDLLLLTIFEPTSSLHRSILVESKTGHRQTGWQIHSNTWPSMYQSSLLYLEREKYLICLYIFEPISSICESILVESKTVPRQRHSNDQTNVYQPSLIFFIDIERLASLVYFPRLYNRFTSLFQSIIKLDTGSDTLILGPICIMRVYSLSIEIKNCFT